MHHTQFAALFAAVLPLLTAAAPGALAAPQQAEPSQKPQKGAAAAPKKKPAAQLKSVNITSNMFEVMPSADQAVWTGSVVATQGDIRIECDKLTATFGENHKIAAIDCEGHVHMVQKAEADAASGRRAKDREAWGDKAHFDNAKSLVVVTGNPSAREGKNTIRGEKVLVYVATERIVVEKPRMVFETSDAVGGAL